MRTPWEAVLRLHRDESGFTLTELLVGGFLTALVMLAVTSLIFTTVDLQRRAQDRNDFAGSIAIASLSLDRDGAMADPTAPARSQTSAVDCTSAMDLGFQEAGASVRFRSIASGTEGPYWLQRLSGAGTRTIARHVAACTWRAVQDPGGRWMIRLDLTLAGSAGESVGVVLRAAPRRW
jgi:hypothetical protein